MLTFIFVTVDFVSPQSIVEQISFEDSVMINSENGEDNLSVKEPPVDSTTVTSTVNELSDPSSPQNMVLNEETKAAPNEEKEEALPPSVGEGETFTSPPPSGGETIASPPPSSGETSALPPAGGEETVTSLTNEETITSLPPSSGETVASPPPSSGETIGSQSPKSTPGTSQYQRMWSWDDTTINTAPATGPIRRVVTCMNRPPPHAQRQQQQQSFDVTVLRRGGSSYHSRSFRHHNRGGPLPPSEC